MHEQLDLLLPLVERRVVHDALAEDGDGELVHGRLVKDLILGLDELQLRPGADHKGDALRPDADGEHGAVAHAQPVDHAHRPFDEVEQVAQQRHASAHHRWRDGRLRRQRMRRPPQRVAERGGSGERGDGGGGGRTACGGGEEEREGGERRREPQHARRALGERGERQVQAGLGGLRREAQQARGLEASEEAVRRRAVGVRRAEQRQRRQQRQQRRRQPQSARGTARQVRHRPDGRIGEHDCLEAAEVVGEQLVRGEAEAEGRVLRMEQRDLGR